MCILDLLIELSIVQRAQGSSSKQLKLSIALLLCQQKQQFLCKAALQHAQSDGFARLAQHPAASIVRRLLAKAPKHRPAR